MWMEVEDGLWVLFGFNGAKRRPFGIMSNELLVREKMGREGTSITVSNSIGFLTTNKGKQTMCSMHTTICTAVRYR
jgi:hypothetical protein